MATFDFPLISGRSFMGFALKFKFSPKFKFGRPGARATEPMSSEQRQRLRAWGRAFRRNAAAWCAEYGESIPPPVWPPFPADLVGLPSGARTRAGTPCKRPARIPSGRCKFHGGQSTGPRTVAGKAKSAANWHCPKRKNDAAV
jgi:hypothetical protein